MLFPRRIFVRPEVPCLWDEGPRGLRGFVFSENEYTHTSPKCFDIWGRWPEAGGGLFSRPQVLPAPPAPSVGACWGLLRSFWGLFLPKVPVLIGDRFFRKRIFSRLPLFRVFVSVSLIIYKPAPKQGQCSRIFPSIPHSFPVLPNPASNWHVSPYQKHTFIRPSPRP